MKVLFYGVDFIPDKASCIKESSAELNNLVHII